MKARKLIIAAYLTGTGVSSAAIQHFAWDATRTSWTGNFWSAGDTAGPYTSAWGGYNDAVFETSGGTVTISGSQNINSLTFNADNYILSGGALNFGNPTGGSYISVASGFTATLNTSFSHIYTSGLTKRGAGTLKLSGSGNSSATNFKINDGTVELTNGTLTTSTSSVVVGNGAAATLNLTGGTLTALGISKGSANGTLNFNGGTLKAGAASTTFLTGLTATNIKAGGAIIDTNSNDITIGQALLHDSGLGATADGGLTKNGAGTLTLTGQSTFTGGAIVNAGTLVLQRPGTGTYINGPLVVNSGATLTFNNNTGGTLDGWGNPVTINGGTVNTTGNNSVWYTAFVMTGGTFNANCSFYGMHVTTHAAATTATISGGSAPYDSNHTFAVEDGTAATDLSVSTPLGGTGTLTKIDEGTLILSNTNTYTGITTISAGTLSTGKVVVSGSNSGLGNASSAVVLGSTDTQGTLDYTGNSDTYTRGFTVNAGGGRINSTTSGQTLTISTNNITGAGILTIGGAGNTTVTSAIQAYALTKVDGGTLTLSGSNSYTGPTNISASTLALTGNGSISSSSSIAVTSNSAILNISGITASTWTVGATQTLSGTGTVNGGSKTIAVNGTIAPGNNGVGNLTVAGDLTLAGLFRWELGALSTDPANYDRITMTSGNANLTDSSLALSLGSFAPGAAPFWQTNQTWSGILNNSGSGTLTGSFAAIDNSTWSTLGSFTTTYTGNDVNLVWTAVPEPNPSFLVVGLVTAGIVGRRRQRC